MVTKLVFESRTPEMHVAIYADEAGIRIASYEHDIVIMTWYDWLIKEALKEVSTLPGYAPTGFCIFPQLCLALPQGNET